jgi:hypothetical protein
VSYNQNVTEEFFNGLYRELNKRPFNVDEIFDKSFYGKTNSITILMFNGYLNEINSNITAESFRSELVRWLKSEQLNFDENIVNFLFGRLIHLSASYLKSEGKRGKKSLLRMRDKFKNEQIKLNKTIEKSPHLQLNTDGITEQMKKKRFILMVSSKGKNPRFLLHETMIIYKIKEFTQYTFENVCLLIAKSYEYFNFLPSKTTAINYSHSLKTNIYQFFKRKKNQIYNLLDMDKAIFEKEYLNHKQEVDNLIVWMKSIIK